MQTLTTWVFPVGHWHAPNKQVLAKSFTVEQQLAFPIAPPVAAQRDANPPSGVDGASVLAPQDSSPSPHASDASPHEGRNVFDPEQHANVSSPHALCGKQHRIEFPPHSYSLFAI
jgi:hypothetical protein